MISLLKETKKEGAVVVSSSLLILSSGMASITSKRLKEKRTYPKI
ncbi:hypothetical protein [Pedobacter steynii]